MQRDEDHWQELEATWQPIANLVAPDADERAAELFQACLHHHWQAERSKGQDAHKLRRVETWLRAGINYEGRNEMQFPFEADDPAILAFVSHRGQDELSCALLRNALQEPKRRAYWLGALKHLLKRDRPEPLSAGTFFLMCSCVCLV
jgi:hypothetical protein